MPSPCSTSVSPDPLSLGLAAAPTTGSADETAIGGDPVESFDNVLSQLDPAAEEPTEPCPSVPPEPAVPGTLLSAEQIALMTQFVPPPPQQPAPAPSTVATNGSSEGCSLQPLGGGNRSLPELLASGVDTLEYHVGPRAAFRAGVPVETTAAAPEADTQAQSAVFAEGATDGSKFPQPLHAESNESRVVPGRLEKEPAQTHAIAGHIPGVAPKRGHTTTAFEGTTVPPAVGLTRSVEISAAPAGDPTTDVASDTTSPEAAVPLATENGVAQAAVVPGSGSVKGWMQNVRRAAAEKFAATGAPGVGSGEVSSGVAGKKVNLIADEQSVKTTHEAVGTTAAKWGKTMFHDARSLAASVLQPDTPAIAGGTSIGNGHTTSASNHQVAATEPSSHAAELVHEIRDIADGLWAVDRNSVEVKFNFGSADRLSVRVEYREGTVHAIFRTDSPELRDAIAREWQAQTASTEQRPYRVADPVFSAGGFSMGGDASRQQRSAEQSGNFERAMHFGGGRSASPKTTSTSPASPTLRAETTGYLHAIV